MAVIATDQSTILTAVVARLRVQVPELSGPSTCFLSDFAFPPPNVEQHLFATVSPADGNFDVGAQEGGGNDVVIEESGVVVTVFSAMKLDRHGKFEHMLQNATKGLLPLKKKILAALASHKLVNDGGDELLAAYMHAFSCSAPKYDERIGLGVMSLHFRLDFEWDLS